MGRCKSKYFNMGIEDLINYLSIKVIEDKRMDDKKNDAVLITGNTKSIIYLKENLSPEYRTFLILHECGHRIFHFQENGRYSYIQSAYCGKLECEANGFACDYLLNGEFLEDTSITELLIHKGVPLNIANTYCEKQISKRT